MFCFVKVNSLSAHYIPVCAQLIVDEHALFREPCVQEIVGCNRRNDIDRISSKSQQNCGRLDSAAQYEGT